MAKGVILVTGAAGFIGSHTTEQLLAAGYRVVGVDNFRTGRRENLRHVAARPEFVLREADVAEPGVLAGIAGEFPSEAVIHLAALVSVYGDGAEAARSEPDLGSPPISPYGAAKLASESLLFGHAAAYGLAVRCQRFFNVYGPRQDPASPYSGVISIFAREYAAGRPPTIHGDGGQTRDFVSVHDVARANLLAATRPGLVSGVANICTGRATSLQRLAEIFAGHYPEVGAPRHAAARPGDIRHSLGDPSRGRDELGFTAQWAIERGLRELIHLPHDPPH